LVQRIAQEKSGIHVDALNVKTNALERWQAQHCIVALPIFIAARVLENPPDFLRQAAQHTAYASWSVANVHINAALLETKGEQGGVDAAWDNVIFNPATATAPSTGGLGYVDAMHQSTRIAPGPSVLSFYRAWGVGADARRSLLERSWAQQRDQTLADLALAHSDIWQRAVQVNITRYGHAMAVPTPEVLKEIGLKSASKMSATLSRHGQARLAYAPRHVPRTPRLRFAHSDWSGYSVFEEAFTRGLHAGLMA
jgi:monoamine oxidase